MSDEIKRLNYFNGQFLVEDDFNDEQKYHLDMRRRLNRSFHTWGVADGGLEVTAEGDNQVSVGAGMAIDREGREIVLLDSHPLDLPDTPDTDIYITVQYQDVQDEADHYTSGGIDNYTRWTERPDLQPTATQPPANGPVITLAKVHLDGDSKVETIDQSVRTIASSRIDPGSDLQLGSLSVSGNLSVAGNIGIGTADPKTPFALRGPDGSTDVGITQKQVGGGSTMELTTADASANQATRILLRGGTDNGDIEFYRGARGAETQSMLIRGSDSSVGIGSDTHPAGHQLDIASSQGTAGNSAIRALYPGGGNLLNTEFGALAHRGNRWTALFAKQGAASSAAYFDGKVGIGTAEPGSQLHLAGGQWNLETTEGDLKIGDETYRMKVGVSKGGGGAGDVRIRAQGGTNRLMLGGGTSDVLTIQNSKVGIGTLIPQATLDVNGSIKSSMWKVTEVFKFDGGPLSRLTGRFQSGGGTILILASGSGYANRIPGVIGMNILIDKIVQGHAYVYANEVQSHKSFITNTLVRTRIAAGNHTVTLREIDPNTIINKFDFIDLTILELPF